MNWADLLEALLLAGILLPLLLRVLGLLSTTTSMVIQTAALTLSTVWSFLRGEADDVVLYAAMTILLLLLLHRDHANDSDRDRDNGTTTSKS
jgi:hypothetical protein